MGEFLYENVKKPEYFQENRMAAHSDHVAYRTKEEAMLLQKSGFRESLNGLWKFHYARSYNSVIQGFEKPEYSVFDWEDIYVPAHIQMEGYDLPQYVNIQYPWDGIEEVEPGEIPESFNPVASYVKYFQAPEGMKGRPLYISFQGVESAFALWLNGSFVGYAADSFTPSEFELTPYVREGENKLAVQVFKWSAGSWLEDQDFYRFSGIFREVFLFTVPERHIWDVKTTMELSEDFAEGILNVELISAGEGGSLQAKLLDPQGNQVGSAWGKTGNREESRMTISVSEPRLWSAEEPNLYLLEIWVLDEQDNLEEYIPVKVGFRRFEMIGNVMHLNGKRIVFKGVNRHEFSCDTGRVVSREEVIRDLTVMKQNNINAVRTCHYPDDSMIYHLADEFGLYLIDECNMETHGTWDPIVRGLKPESYAVPGDRMEYLPMMLDRVHSIYERDKNHPCVLIWSCGNESYGGSVIYEMSEEFRRLDPHRLVHYEGVFNDRRYNGSSDMESQMYTPAAKIEEFLREHRDKPFICCEYAHAMGNSCGGMHKYTDLTDREPLYQGGFIWDYVDQSIRKKDRYGREFQAYGGDCGERPTDYNFSGNGIVDGARRISPKMQEVKYNYQNISVEVRPGSFTVLNKNLFTNTSRYTCRVALMLDGKEIERREVFTDVEPLSRKDYGIPFVLRKAQGEYVVTVSFHLKEDTAWAKAGHEVAFGQGILKKKEEKKQEKADGACRPVTLVMGTYNVGIRGEHFSALFSRLNGGLVSYRYGGREMIEAIPRPNFWRAPTDNDCGNNMAARYGQWKLASLYASHYNPEDPEGTARLENPQVKTLENGVRVTFTYYLPTTPAASCRLAYEVSGDGSVKTTLSYDPVKELGEMPEFGVMFKLNADYRFLEWYGQGPEDCYADRRRGGRLGIHKKTVEENMAHYLVPQECGNHTGVRYMKVTDYKGRGMLFTGEDLEICVTPYTPHELENAMHPYELPQVHYTVVRAGRQMGVGGDNSWGARTLDEYLLDPSEKMEVSFSFKGI